MGKEFKRDLVTALVIDPENPDILYADTLHAGMYKSINGGNLWNVILPVDLSIDHISSLENAASDERRDVNIFSNTAPDGIKRLYQYGSVKEDEFSYWYLSADDGKTWSRFSEGGTYRDFVPIAFDKLGSVYVFCGRNICKFSSDGKPLKILKEPGIGSQSVIVVSQKDPNTIYAAGNGIAVTKDGGLNWTRLDNRMGNDILQLELGLEKTPFLYMMVGECFVQTNNQGIEQPLYRSADGGQTWDFITSAGCDLIKDADGKTLYRHAENTLFNYFYPYPKHKILLSPNSGKSWVNIHSPIVTKTIVADNNRSGVLFALSDSSDQYISEGFGNSWKKAQFTSVRDCYGSTAQFINAYRPMAIDSHNGDHVYYIYQGVLRESRDGCGSWKDMEQQPPNPINDVALDPNKPDTIYTGTNNGAYISSDGGATWGQVNYGLAGSPIVYSIAVDSESNVYATTPYGIFKLGQK